MLTKRTTGQSDKMAMSNNATAGSSKYAPPTELKQMIEDVTTDELKLFFIGYTEIFQEFSVLKEITTSILHSMGIFPKLIQREQPSKTK